MKRTVDNKIRIYYSLLRTNMFFMENREGLLEKGDVDYKQGDQLIVILAYKYSVIVFIKLCSVLINEQKEKGSLIC